MNSTQRDLITEETAGRTMAYKVLARKCRPQTFDEVIGQGHVTRTLKNAIRENRIAHAFLFTGERGVGKTSVARILAKALNCHTGPTDKPCNTCPSCTEITNSNAIDVHEIDGASNTGVDDIRTLRENVKYLPSRDRYKIYIIDEVHMLSKSAFNALLKTLEEPPDHVIFMFATTDPQKIPETIISRCLRFDFKRISANEIVRHLKNIAERENISVSSRGLSLIAREADGSMRDSQTIFERAISYCGNKIEDTGIEELLGHVDSQFIYRIMDAVCTDNAQACMDTIHDIYEYGVDFRKFYFALLEHLRDLIMVKTLQDPSKTLDYSDEDLKKLQSLVEKIEIDALHRCFRLWFTAEGQITRSAFPKIAMEVSLLEMIQIKKAIPVDEIISRLDKLQQAAPARSGTYVPPAKKHGPAKVSQPKSPYPDADPAAPASDHGPAGAKTAKFIDLVRRKHTPLFSSLQSADITLNGIELSITPASNFDLDRLKDPETEHKLEALCREIFDKDTRLVIRAGSQKKTPDREQKTQDQQQKLRKEVNHNPVIQKVMESFSGSRIVDIKPE